MVMNQRFSIMNRAWQAGLAVVAAVALVTGAAWHVAANSQTTTHAATVTTPIAHPIAGGRDSYADVVNVVAPAVVTIRVEGKGKAQPTEFQQPNEDMLRRFFGDQFGGQFGDRSGRGQREQPAPKQRGLGSGVVVTTDGYILTNFHVVDGADNIKVEMTDGRTLSAKLVGTDKASDLALLKINATDLHALALGNSDAVQVGDVVLAVGNPMGIGQTVTMGIISAKER